MTTQSRLVEDAVVEHYWNDIRLPALKRESLMLHDAYAAAARTNQTGQNHVGFDPFFEAVIEFKKNVRVLPIKDLDSLDAIFQQCCQTYLSGENTFYFARKLNDALHTHIDNQSLNSEEDSPEYRAARYNAIAYDTSESLDNIGRRICSQEGRALLYNYALRGPSEVSELIGNRWPQGHHKDSISDLTNGFEAFEIKTIMKRRAVENASTSERPPQARKDDNGNPAGHITLVASI